MERFSTIKYGCIFLLFFVSAEGVLGRDMSSVLDRHTTKPTERNEYTDSPTKSPTASPSGVVTDMVTSSQTISPSDAVKDVDSHTNIPSERNDHTFSPTASPSGAVTDMNTSSQTISPSDTVTDMDSHTNKPSGRNVYTFPPSMSPTASPSGAVTDTNNSPQTIAPTDTGTETIPSTPTDTNELSADVPTTIAPCTLYPSGNFGETEEAPESSIVKYTYEVETREGEGNDEDFVGLLASALGNNIIRSLFSDCQSPSADTDIRKLQTGTNGLVKVVGLSSSTDDIEPCSETPPDGTVCQRVHGDVTVYVDASSDGSNFGHIQEKARLTIVDAFAGGEDSIMYIRDYITKLTYIVPEQNQISKLETEQEVPAKNDISKMWIIASAIGGLLATAALVMKTARKSRENADMNNDDLGKSLPGAYDLTAMGQDDKNSNGDDTSVSSSGVLSWNDLGSWGRYLRSTPNHQTEGTVEVQLEV